MSILTETLLESLRQKVSNEMARRKYGSGPLDSFSGQTFDNPVTRGSLIMDETGKKTLDLLLKIKNIDSLTAAYSSDAGTKIPQEFDTRLIDLVDDLTTETRQGASSCRANCTGLCTGCAGLCGSSSCSGDCDSDCDDTCSARCADSCKSGCGGCTGCGTCGTSCTSGCGGNSCKWTAAGDGCTCEGCGDCGGGCGAAYGEND